MNNQMTCERAIIQFFWDNLIKKHVGMEFRGKDISCLILDIRVQFLDNIGIYSTSKNTKCNLATRKSYKNLGLLCTRKSYK